jgi:parallel beta-helix repeat protein
LRLLYYTRAGVYAYRSPYLSVERCVMFNGRGYVNGHHIFAFYSPHATITRSLLIGGESGIYLLESPFAVIRNNTISQGMFSGVALSFSVKGTKIINNAIGFGMNDCVSGETHHPDELKSFYSDYNNLGTDVTEHNKGMNNESVLWKQIQAESFKIDYPRTKFSPVSKAIIGIGKRYRTMKAWREASGQDKHSIFADPKYIRPWPPVDTWDWSLKPDSPNIGTGENGATIGALEAVK